MKRLNLFLTAGALSLVSACSDQAASPTALDVEPSFMMESCELLVSEAEAIAHIDALIAGVNSLEAAGSLNSGRANALRRHLEDARRQIERGQVCAALAQLRSFRRQVESFEGAGVLTGPEAGPLLTDVDAVLDPPIINPSFEADGAVFLDPGAVTGWVLAGISDFATDQFGGSVNTSGSFDASLVTDGDYGARIFSRTGADQTGAPVPRTFTVGEYAALSQDINLTGVDVILFDAELRQAWDATIFEARVLVDGVVRWSNQTVAVYLNQSIDVTPLTGLHTFEFRLEAIATATVAGLTTSRWFLFDNVRLSSGAP